MVLYASLAILIAGTGCIGSRFSNKRKGESLSLKVAEDGNYLALHDLRYQDIPGLASRGNARRGIALGQVFSLAIQGVNKLIELDRSKFTASYDQSLGELYFYDQISDKGHFDPTGIQFKNFEVQRKIKLKKRDTTAFSAVFEIDTGNKYEIINASVFRLKIRNLSLRYSKAKASDTRWYAPWSWGNAKIDDKMNMDIQVRFITSYVTADGKMMDNVQVGKFNLNLRDMPMDPNDPAYAKYYQDLVGKQLGGYSFIIPRSFGYALDERGELKEVYSQGNYKIELSITETGKEKFIKKVLAENSTDIMKSGSNELMKMLQKK